MYKKCLDFLDDRFGYYKEDIKGLHGFFFWNIFPWITVTLYFVMIKYLPGVLISMRGEQKKPEVRKKGPPVKKSLTELSLLELVMVFHNALLSFFSGLVFLIVVVFFYGNWLSKPGGWFLVVCDPDGGVAKSKTFTHLMSYLFVLSKYWELLDSVFLILKRPDRPLEFLHWYHHITVLIFTQYSSYYELTVGYVFGTVNLLVHTLMYYYYGVAILGYRPKWAFFLTILQMVQMFWGLFILCLFFYYYVSGYGCHCARGVYIFFIYGFIMYGSYLYLFFTFFLKRYFGKKKSAKKTK